MKKSIKVISTLLLAIMLVATIATTAFAAVDLNGTLGRVENTNLSNTNADQQITTIGGNIVNIIQIVGIVIAIIVLLVIGIKYMIGSASEKAEYKKTMIPYIVGAVLVFAGTSLVKVIYSLATAVK